MTEPCVPEARMVYWLETTIIPVGDGEWWRPAVVVAASPAPAGTVTVVSRSANDGFGVEHPAGGSLGFSSPGRFSRRHPVPRQLWTPAHVAPIGPLDETVFAAVVARFGL